MKKRWLKTIWFSRPGQLLTFYSCLKCGALVSDELRGLHDSSHP